MDFRSNEDWYCRNGGYDSGRGVSYNQVIDFLFIEGSGDATEPITDADYCDFAKIDSAMQASDATQIHAIALAVRSICEGFLNMSLVPRQVQAILNNGNGGAYLPYGPVGDILEVVNSEGAAIEGYKIEGLQWKQLISPTYDRITINYEAGYPNVPSQIKLGMKQAFFYLWDNRSVAIDSIGEVAYKTLNPYRRVV